MARFHHELYGSRGAVKRNAAAAVAFGVLALVLGLVIVAGGNSGGWVPAAIGAAAVLVVVLLPRLTRGRSRNHF
jgi:hypothetical protein